jgi:GT2 family glycosyltransferase
VNSVPEIDQYVDLSIVIVTYNGREFALQTLDSFLSAIAADSEHRYEIIVVDNASRDGVADAVAEVSVTHGDVRLIRNDDNLGYSRANNIGFEACVGRYLLFANPDVEVNDRTLPTLLATMDAHPEVGACTPYLELVRTGGIDWGAHRGFPTPWASFTYMSGLARLFRFSKRLSRVFGRYHLLDRDLARAHGVDAIRGGFFFVQREVFEEAGRWDEDYFMYGEDLDLCFAIKQRGHSIMFYPQARALHYHGLTTGLKAHSQELSSVDAEARRRAYASFYETMKVFYDKHYRQRYGPLVRWLIFRAIDARKMIGMRRLTV